MCTKLAQLGNPRLEAQTPALVVELRVTYWNRLGGWDIHEGDTGVVIV
jgi:hypothetical protein